MTRRLTVLVPGDFTTRTGGYEYDRRIVAGLRARGWTVEVVTLAGTFPFPKPDALGQAAEALAGLADDGLVLIDGLALGAMPDHARAQAHRLRLVALVHHPLASETGLAPDVATRLATSERLALTAVRAVVVTSAATAVGLESYGVTPDRLVVVEPGTDPAPVARGSGSDAPHLLSVASLTARKGHDLLVEALAPLRDRPWRLTIVGSRTREPAAAARVKALVEARGLTERVQLAGEADATAISGVYDGADLFVTASYHEGYGMAVAEALARALPVVGTATGAIPELVGDDAGLIVPVGDCAALTLALAQVLDDPALRTGLAAGALARRQALPTWDDAAERMAATLAEVSG